MIVQQNVFGVLYISIVASAFYIQGQAYYRPLVKMSGVQSLLIALLSLLVYVESGSLDYVYLAVILGVVRGVITPYVLLRVLGERYGEREKISGFASLLIIDLSFFFIAVFVLYNFVITRLFPGDYYLVFAFSLFFQGLYLIASRNSTPSQIVGYLEEENALVLFGLLLIPIPLLIEASVLLDVLGLVVISAVIIYEKKIHTPLEELKG
ncbi:MAG: hydrogenase [Thermoprotei archaeon]